MRRVFIAALFVASSVGLFVAPSGADPSTPASVVLSFDFGDNSAPATSSASSNFNGPFNIIADVLPEHTGGFVRMIAIPPDSSNLPNLVCDYQPVQQSQVECPFSFTTNGVWTIRTQYATDTKSAVSSISVTRLRVTN
ncbi:MAG TPA: hypothetical protein VIJ40_08510 [Acidimicrobiales bacterium]